MGGGGLLETKPPALQALHRYLSWQRTLLTPSLSLWKASRPKADVPVEEMTSGTERLSRAQSTRE